MVKVTRRLLTERDLTWLNAPVSYNPKAIVRSLKKMVGERADTVAKGDLRVGLGERLKNETD